MNDPIVLKPEIWEIDKVLPYENNSKIHKPEQVSRIAESIKDQGLEQYPHVQPDGILIAGHGRLEALKLLGWKKVPVYVRNDLDEMGWRKLRLASNKSASTEYDVRLEKIEVTEMLALIGDDADLEILALQTGFSARDLEIFTEDLGESSIDFDDIDLSLDGEEEDTSSSDVSPKEKTTPLTKIFGFSAVSASESRILKRFLSDVREQSSEDATNVEALIEHAKKHMSVSND